MTDHVYKHVRITGTSKVSSDEAVTAAIAKAEKPFMECVGLK